MENFDDGGIGLLLGDDNDELTNSNTTAAPRPSLPPLPRLLQESAPPPPAPVELPDLDVEALCETEALESHFQHSVVFSWKLSAKYCGESPVLASCLQVSLNQ